MDYTICLKDNGKNITKKITLPKNGDVLKEVLLVAGALLAKANMGSSASVTDSNNKVIWSGYKASRVLKLGGAE